jgi:hypothetical protein
LSKIIVSHVGHFVQRPSGISRFLDLELPVPSFGFFVKAVCVCAIGGGVSAGSIVETPPSDFFVNEVVSIRLIK